MLTTSTTSGHFLTSLVQLERQSLSTLHVQLVRSQMVTSVPSDTQVSTSNTVLSTSKVKPTSERVKFHKIPYFY